MQRRRARHDRVSETSLTRSVQPSDLTSAVEPEHLRRQPGLAGDRRATWVLTQPAGRHWKVLVLEPAWRARGGQPEITTLSALVCAARPKVSYASIIWSKVNRWVANFSAGSFFWATSLSSIAVVEVLTRPIVMVMS